MLREVKRFELERKLNMSYAILIILLVSALGHAIWNAIAKRVEERDAFFTLILGVSVILYSPMALYLLITEPFPREAWGWIALSIVFEILYFVTLAKAYRVSPLTTAYPIVRGTAPIATIIISFLMIGSGMEFIGLIGILMIVFGILFINQKKLSLSGLRSLFSKDFAGTKWALLTGIFIACYNVSDGMGALIMSGFLFKYVVFIGMFIGKWFIDHKLISNVSYISLFKKYPIETFLAGLLVFGANSLVVYAMESTSVVYVASVREMSIVFAAFIGFMWMKEKISKVKSISIAMIVAGVLLIKFG
jgi:drug/metabolite transporter (DMT)-like permease